MNAPPPSAGLTAVVTALGARRRLRELLVGAQTWDLIAGAAAAGWFTALGAVTTAEALAADHGLPVEQVADVLVVLTGAGVAVGHDDGTVSLAPDLAALLAGPSGVEIDPAVGEELTRRVADAGLTDRVTVHVGDAADLTATDRFDVAYWAQEFFADDARASVLAVLVRALRPGGWLLLQELATGAPEDAPAAALDRLFRRGWNAARSRTAEELAAEATGVGLESVGICESAAGRLVLLRRPLTN